MASHSAKQQGVLLQFPTGKIQRSRCAAFVTSFARTHHRLARPQLRLSCSVRFPPYPVRSAQMSTTADIIEPGQLAWYRKAVPALFVPLIACSFGGALLYKIRVDGIFACQAAGYGSNAYLSDCTAKTYGDYDHGAFWFGLEPQAQRAAAEADVLIVGSSRLQFAFSSAATANWFSAQGIRYYLLGLSHSETVVFVGPLLSKMRPRARVYVINVDRLFDDRVSPPTEQILQGRDILERYKQKRTWQSLHRGLCTALPAACGNAFAVYRARETGVWRRIGGGPFRSEQVSDGRPSKIVRWDEYARLGE